MKVGSAAVPERPRTGQRSLRLGLVFTVAVVATSSFPRAAAAEGSSNHELATAEALFDEGLRLMQSAHYEQACPKFAESLRLDVGIGTMLWLADCYERTGKTASAWAQFREAVWTAEKQRDPRAKLARAKANELAPKVGRVRIVLAEGLLPDGLRITRDGIAVAPSVLGVEVPLDPGEHVVRVERDGSRPWQNAFSAAPPGTSATWIVPPLEPLGADAVSTAPPQALAMPKAKSLTSHELRDRESAGSTGSPGTLQRGLGVAVSSAGLLSVAIGSAFGVKAHLKLSESDAHCNNNICDPTGGELRGDARDAAHMSTALFAAGAGGFVGGILIYMTAPSRHAFEVKPSVSPQSVGLRLTGRF